MNKYSVWTKIRALIGDPVAEDEMRRDYFINMKLWKVKRGRLYKVGMKRYI